MLLNKENETERNKITVTRFVSLRATTPAKTQNFTQRSRGGPDHNIHI